MNLIPGLEPQPSFPKKDITDKNAGMLELLLANEEIVLIGHEASEKLSWVFKVGHPAIVRGAGRIHDDSRKLAAVDRGVAIFETATTMLTSNPPDMDWSTVNTNGVALATAFNSRNLEAYADTAMHNFTENMPLTREVVEKSAARFFPYFTTYAALGAALARQFELDAV